MGWLGFAGVESLINLLGVLAWWANPFYLYALIKSLGKGRVPTISVHIALALASLTVFLSSYAVNAVPVFTPVIAYGPGALLWYLAILGLTYVVARDAGHVAFPTIIPWAACALCAVYSIQLTYRATRANISEQERLPFYSAKRGFICTAKATPLPISEHQPAIGFEGDAKYWLKSLRNWNISAVQIGSVEYQRAPEGSFESRKSPFMTEQPISSPARYTLRVEGGYPYSNDTSDPGDLVRLSLIDNQTNTVLGELVHKRELNRRLGFCPTLTYFPKSRHEEAILWLAAFVKER